jgi:hypothetical protein
MGFTRLYCREHAAIELSQECLQWKSVKERGWQCYYIMQTLVSHVTDSISFFISYLSGKNKKISNKLITLYISFTRIERDTKMQHCGNFEL